MEKALLSHIKDNLGLYLTVTLFFVGGIVTGTLVIQFLDRQHVIQLADYLDNIFKQFDGTTPELNKVVYQALINSIKETGLVWFLGLTVVGIPLIVAIIFLKGFVLGFTVGFIIEQKAFQGVAFSLLTILPPNLIQIPALFVATILSISFSLGLLRGNIQTALWQRFFAYSIYMFFITLVLVGGGMVEAYLSPVFARVVLNYF
ncbi:MAG: stage sporulation protein [Clostridia bacterium]|nr:stage sporulation protein [Clostridia bacterium]